MDLKKISCPNGPHRNYCGSSRVECSKCNDTNYLTHPDAKDLAAEYIHQAKLLVGEARWTPREEVVVGIAQLIQACDVHMENSTMPMENLLGVHQDSILKDT